MIPDLRRSLVNDRPLRQDGDYVLYWMISSRRTRFSFALDHALDQARALGKPLVVLEALRCGYRWASDRIHQFVFEGMVDNARRLRRPEVGIVHYCYVEAEEGAGHGLLEALADGACLVVTDEFPCFFLPRMVASAGAALPVRLEQVDGNGLLPLRAADKTFLRAVDLRRYLQKNLAPHLHDMPRADPLADLGGALPAADASLLEDLEEIEARWPNRSADFAQHHLPDLAALPIDHDVAPAPSVRGGEEAAEEMLRVFLEARIDRYTDDRRNLDERACSELSPHLHFGHIGVHRILAAVAERHGWDPSRVSGQARGARLGWWGLPEPVESFLDEVVTWRELGYNFCSREDDYAAYQSLPDWAKQTLEEHAGDPRPWLYDLEELEHARTHDEVWNAAQRELVEDGRIHNYLRMLWGKKIFEWSPTPEDAVDAMIELNNKYALDGRNPNSYSGIFWVLGRYDRPWGPERDVYGKIRYMTSEQAKKKLDMKAYLSRYGPNRSL